MSRKFTVVLLYPDYLCEGVPYGQEVFVASGVAAESKEAALALAQDEAFKSCKCYAGPESHLDDPCDFALCVMFEGDHQPVLFGWQL